MKYPNFVGSGYSLQSKNAAGDRCINRYVEVIESGTGKDGATKFLAPVPGYKTLVTLPDAPLRALYSGDGVRVFALAGATLFELTKRTPPPSRMSANELRFAILQAAGGDTAALQTAAQWAALYVQVTAENAPQPATYGITNPAATWTLDQWFPLFMSEASYRTIGKLPPEDGELTARAQMFANGNSLFLVAGTHGYICDGKNITSVTDAVQGTYIDGYYIALDPGGTKFHISGLYDGTAWSALDYGAAEGEPDATVAMLADHRELWLFGQMSTEVFDDDGNPNFPFERNPAGFIEQGCGAANSPLKLDNSVFWLGNDEHGGRIVWRAVGYQASRVSNHALEAAMKTYPRVDDAETWGYQDGGGSFLVIHFPSANPHPLNPTAVQPSKITAAGATWVYDCAASAQLGSPQWHERLHWDAIHGAWLMHRGRVHAYAWGKHLIGDWHTGQVYHLSTDYRTDDGLPLRWLRSAPHVSNEMKVNYYDAFLLDLEVGDAPDGTDPNALVDGSGNPRAPQVCVRFSNNGGKTWSQERWISTGKLGDYSVRARSTRLGRGRDRCFEVSGSDPVFGAMTNADLEITAGNGA